MRFDNRHYVPCLRWKQGEYQAVSRLSDSAKNALTPLIEVAEIGFDFEAQEQSRSVDAHLDVFARRVGSKWGRRPCFVDLRLIDQAERMADSRHPVEFVFGRLGEQNCAAVPITAIHRDRHYQRAVRSVALRDGRGVCLRLSIEDASGSELKDLTDTLLGDLKLDRKSCDLIIDLGAPNFEPVEGFAKLIAYIMQNLPHLSQWRSFTLMGTSFPQSMGEIEMGLTTIRRWEWILYKRVVEQLKISRHRLPTFGDYAINYPDVLPMDMRMLKPSATIRYAVDDAWLIVKGKNVRDYKFDQYHELCQSLVGSPHFLGAQFSAEDEHIAACADGGKTGNLSTWRRVGTGHHLEKVVRDIANFSAALGNL